MRYLAILFAVDADGYQTFSFSREVDTDDKERVLSFLMSDGSVARENIDTILLVKNGHFCPDVVKFWTAGNGDFEEKKDGG